MTILFQKSVSGKTVPQDWKAANVTPIHKKGNRNRTENYRPISLTSQVGNLLESLIKDDIVSYLEHHKLITNSQHGFRKGFSCLSNSLMFLDRVTRSVDYGIPVDAIFLDFAKAFDTVPHRRLLSKLGQH